MESYCIDLIIIFLTVSKEYEPNYSNHPNYNSRKIKTKLIKNEPIKSLSECVLKQFKCFKDIGIERLTLCFGY